MVQRSQNSSDGFSASPLREDTPPPSAPLTPDQRRIAELEAERDTLTRTLHSAHQRIQELEVTQGAVVTRIDALITALGTALEKRV